MVGMHDAFLALGVALIAVSGTWIGTRHGRIAKLERRVVVVEKENKRLWLELRRQIDHSYRNGIQPLPLNPDLLESDE